MTAPDSNTDVFIIGGGPAGSAIAKRLAEFGHDIILVEKAVFPRPHVGICLSDTSDSLLDYLGVGSKIEKAAFFRRKTTLVKWASDKPVIAEQPGSHVDRGVFDQLLLENAQLSGVKILQPARTTSIQRDSESGWKIAVKNGNETCTIYARFVVDASGGAGALTGKRVRYAPPLFAMHAIWRLRNRPCYDGFMEAGRDAWLWIAGLRQQRAMISVYTDPKHFSDSGCDRLEVFYESLLDQFSLMRYCEREGFFEEVKGCGAGGRYATQSVGNDFIRVGDSNLSVDPMASQGVHMALSSGIQAAVVANTILRYPEHAEAAQQFYRTRQQEQILRFQERTASEYGRVAVHSNESFWQERANDAGAPPSPPVRSTYLPQLTAHQEIRLCPSAKFLPTPVLRESYIAVELALDHPKLDRSVAFLGGINLVPLLRELKEKHSVASLLTAWQSRVSNELGMEIIQWLWAHQIIIPDSASRFSDPPARKTFRQVEGPV